MTSCVCPYTYSLAKTDSGLGNYLQLASPNLCSAVSVLLDITVRDSVGDDVERNNNGMMSSIFISDYCASKFPFHICVSLKTNMANKKFSLIKTFTQSRIP